MRLYSRRNEIKFRHRGASIFISDEQTRETSKLLQHRNSALSPNKDIKALRPHKSLIKMHDSISKKNKYTTQYNEQIHSRNY